MKNFLLKLTTFTCSLLLLGTIAQAQDIHFSQLSETPLLRNPALAGLFEGDVRLQSVYRSQWNDITDAYTTVSSNMEFKVPIGQGNDFATLGAQVLYDKAGTTAFTSTHILPVLNYHKSLSEDNNMYLSLAAMGGYVQRSIDKSKMTTNSQFDGTHYVPGSNRGEYFSNGNYHYFDATVGLSFNTQIGQNQDDNMYAGVAYHHLNKAKNLSFYTDYDQEMAPKWVVSGGVRTGIEAGSYITIEGDYSKQQSYSSTTVGVIWSKKLDGDNDGNNSKYLIHAGGYYRLNDAFIPVIKLEAKPVAIAISYDANVSELSRISRGRGGFELSITYQKFNKGYNSSLDATRCPRF